MNKEDLEKFYNNANEEELLKREAELMSHGNILSANLSTCEAYGLSGNCGSKCPKFKDKSCEVYDEVLEQENTNLKQALNEIRDNIKDKGQRHQMAVLEQMTVEDFCLDGYECMDILQIIDKVLGDEK